jgi:hypothetical protein
MVGRIVRSTREEVTGGRRKFHSNELHNLYPSRKIRPFVRVRIKFRNHESFRQINRSAWRVDQPVVSPLLTQDNRNTEGTLICSERQKLIIWAGHVKRIEGMRSTYEISVKKTVLTIDDHFEYT